MKSNITPFVPVRKKLPILTVHYKYEFIRMNAELMEAMKLICGERVNFFELDGALLLAKSDTGYKLTTDGDGKLKIRCRTFVKHLSDKLGITKKAKRNPQRYISKRYRVKITNVKIMGENAGEVIIR